jgi:molybdopterin synthase catalytic subunit
MNFEIHFIGDPIVVPAMRMPSKEVGAVVEFHGVVRETEGETVVPALWYETYEEMARREFGRILAELSKRHPVHDVTIIHRIGRVPAGEASLYVRVMARHRGEALSFCGELIDRMKKDVPIWKTASPATG